MTTAAAAPHATCAHCGTAVLTGKRTTVYCSGKCRTAAYRARKAPTADALTTQIAALTQLAVARMARLAEAAPGPAHDVAVLAKRAEAAVEALGAWAEACGLDPADFDTPLPRPRTHRITDASAPAAPQTSPAPTPVVTEPPVTPPPAAPPPEPQRRRPAAPRARSSRAGRTPTAEQAAVIGACASGRNLVVEAGAGTGKTTTMAMAAEALGANGLYTAYNKDIVTDAAKAFPAHVTLKTGHALAHRDVVRGTKFQQRLNGSSNVPSSVVATRMGIDQILQLGPELRLHPAQLAQLAMQTVQRYCHTADPEITSGHIPQVAGVDSDTARGVLNARILGLATQAWADLRRPGGTLPFKHDHYLKLWQLGKPNLPFRWIVLDEGQDTNPAMADVLQRQKAAQLIVVGDSQQSLYAWRGAVDVLPAWPADVRHQLTQSWRFGPVGAAEANKWLTQLGATLRLTGNPALDTRLGSLDYDVDAVLCRTNAEAMRQAMGALAKGLRPSLAGGTGTLVAMAKAALALQKHQPHDSTEFGAFETWEQLVEYARNEDAGAELRTFVGLIETHGAQEILESVKDIAKDQDESADIVISTAHRAKGREWSRVRIADDFRPPRRDADGERGPIRREEGMLAYVAVTRAREVLDRGSLTWIDDYSQPARPTRATTTVTAPRGRGPAVLVNKFDAECRTCQADVPAYDGRLIRLNDSWITFCDPCAADGAVTRALHPNLASPDSL